VTVAPLRQDTAVHPDLFRPAAPARRPPDSRRPPSVSLDPPLVSFCLANTASAGPAVARAQVVAVHVLSREQEQVARIFATSGIDRFAAHGAWRPGPAGVPLLDGVLARWCAG
jgi:hypothetical protein